MQELGSHYAAFSKISTGEQKLNLGGSKEQESSPLLAARTPRKAGHTEMASSRSRSCSTAGDLCRIAPPSPSSSSSSPLSLSLTLSLTLKVRAFSFAFGADEISLQSTLKSARTSGRTCIPVQTERNSVLLSAAPCSCFSPPVKA
jgi:hypothetical protein